MSEQPPEPDRAFHVFSTSDEAGKWIEEKALAWNRELSPDEKAAAVFYKGPMGDEYDKINGFLRGTASLSVAEAKAIRAVIGHLDAAIEKGEVERSLVLYRGIKDYPGLQDKLVVGADIPEKAYFSLTADRDFAHDLAGSLDPGVVYEVRVPARTRAGFPDRLEVSQGELEVLLGRGTIYRVLSIQKPLNPSGHTILTVEVLS